VKVSKKLSFGCVCSGQKNIFAETEFPQTMMRAPRLIALLFACHAYFRQLCRNVRTISICSFEGRAVATFEMSVLRTAYLPKGLHANKQQEWQDIVSVQKIIVKH